MHNLVHTRLIAAIRPVVVAGACLLAGPLSAQVPAPPVAAAWPKETFPDSAAGKAPTSPRQGWARIDGLEKLEPLRQPFTAAQVADRLAIQDAFARWGIAFDEGRGEVVTSLFTEDGYMQGANGKFDPNGARTSGPAAIATFATEGWKGQADQRRHILSNIVITSLARDRATALAYGVVTVAADGLYLGATVIYSADLRKESDGIWRFSRFIIGMDHYVARPSK